MGRGLSSASGPPPQADALGAAGWEILWPREGDTPEWPAAVPEPSVVELAMWAEEWRTAQASKWEERRQENQVASYVRAFVESNLPGATAGLKTVVARMEESLGKSSAGLARNRWVLGVKRPDGEAAKAEPRARARFEVVQGGRDSAAA